MLKKIILAVALMLPMLGASAQSTLKLGLVDSSTLIQAMPETQQAQNKLADVSKKYEAEYQQMGEEMNRLMDELQKLPQDELAAVRERKVSNLQEKQQRMQAFEQQAQQDLQRTQAELMQPIIQKIKEAVEAVSKENGFSMVQTYDPSLMLYYASPVEDITPLVKAKLGVK